MKKSIKILATVFLFSIFLIGIVEAKIPEGVDCTDNPGDCEAGLTCQYPKNGGATAYCSKGIAGAGKLEDGIKCTDASQCLGGYCEYDSKGNRVCGHSPSKFKAPETKAPSSLKHFNYELLEAFPGFYSAGQTMTDFPDLVLSIYKFGIWTVGIAGMFMITIGGIMYMGSAGNKSTASSARGIITDAIIGVVAALTAYLFLYVINPDLVKLNLNFTKVSVSDPIGAGGLGGNCEPVTKNGSPATVYALTNQFGSNATKASSIAKIESGGNPNLLSQVDMCQDGNSFSVGLFQINMIDSASSICNGNGDIFTTGKSKGECVKRNSNNICIRWSCEVKDKAKYNECLAKLKDPIVNINLAKQISNNGNSWSRWGANRVCKF